MSTGSMSTVSSHVKVPMLMTETVYRTAAALLAIIHLFVSGQASRVSSCGNREGVEQAQQRVKMLHYS